MILLINLSVFLLLFFQDLLIEHVALPRKITTTPPRRPKIVRFILQIVRTVRTVRGHPALLPMASSSRFQSATQNRLYGLNEPDGTWRDALGKKNWDATGKANNHGDRTFL